MAEDSVPSLLNARAALCSASPDEQAINGGVAVTHVAARSSCLRDGGLIFAGEMFIRRCGAPWLLRFCSRCEGVHLTKKRKHRRVALRSSQTFSTQRNTIAMASKTAMLAAQMPTIQNSRFQMGVCNSSGRAGLMAGQRNGGLFTRDIRARRPCPETPSKTKPCSPRSSATRLPFPKA